MEKRALAQPLATSTSDERQMNLSRTALTALCFAGLAVTSAHADNFGSGGNQFIIDFVTIGDPGNPVDTGTTGSYFSSYGAVGYTFRMGTYEISEDMIEKANALSTMYRDGVIDTNEYREQMNFEPLEDGENPASQPLNIVEGNVVTPYEMEVRKWKRMASKRYVEGKPAKALEFESDLLPPLLMESVKGALEAARTAEEAALAIDNALLWKEYP